VSRSGWFLGAYGGGIGLNAFLHDTWPDIREGAAILTTPRAHVTDVLLVEIASYVARVAVTATSCVHTTCRGRIDVCPDARRRRYAAGARHGRTAQRRLVERRRRYSLGPQLSVAAWAIAFGLLVLWSAIGWRATRALLQHGHRMPPITHPAAERRRAGRAP
jgi:hypothetical protein